MNDLLTFIDGYTLALNVLAVAAYTLCVRRVTAFNVVVAGGIALNFAHLCITNSLTPLFGVDEYKQVISAAWYLSFAVTDLMFVIAIKMIVTKFDLLRDRVSTLFIYCHMYMAFIQIARFGDRSVFGTDVLGGIYSTSIVATNALISITLLLFTVRVLAMCFGSKVALVRGS